MEIGYTDVVGPRSLGLIADSAPVQGLPWSRPAEASVMERRDGEAIVTWKGYGGEVRAGGGNDRLLTEFMDLADAPAGDLAPFVEKWGPLNLCKHGVPATHRPRRMWDEFAEFDAAPCDITLARPRGDIGEPIERWHHFAAHVSALHVASRHLFSGRRLTQELWSALLSAQLPHSPHEEADYESWQRTTELDSDERLVAGGLQKWLDFGDVGIHVIWKDGRASVHFGGKGLAGALGLQLAMTSTTTGSFYTCSGCAVPYLPERRPRSGENNYCSDCRDDGVPERDRARAYRARRRES